MGMTIREKRIYLAKQNAKWPTILAPIPREEWPKSSTLETGVRIGAMRSRFFLVQVFDEGAHQHFGKVHRITVNRTDINSDGSWVAGITWDELQRLKSEAGFPGHNAIEIYPPDGEIVNVANMRHLWVFEERFSFQWGYAK